MQNLNEAAKKLTPEQLQEFESLTDKSGGEHACWIWNGQYNDLGEPIFTTTVNGKEVTFLAAWLSLWLYRREKIG